MRPLLLSSTFLLLIALLVSQIWFPTRSWRDCWRLLANRWVVIFLLAGGMLNFCLRITAGYINPRDYVQDAVAARQLLRGETIYPSNMPALGAAEVAVPMPGRTLLEKSPVFAPEFSMLHITAPVNAHPPFLALLTAPPYAVLGLRGAFLFTVIVSLLLIVISTVWVLRELFAPLSSWHWLALFGLQLGWYSVSSLLRSGQPSSVLLFLLVLSWRWLRKGNHWAAGIPAGLAASIQAFPALLLGLFFWRSWRSCLSALATILLTMLASLALTVPGTFQQWLATTEIVSRDFIPVRTNLSLAGLVAGFQLSLGIAPDARWISVVITLLIAIILTVWLCPWRPAPKSVPQIDIEFSAFMVAMLLASPLFWPVSNSECKFAIESSG